MLKLFPFEGAENLTIVLQGLGTKGKFSYCLTNCITCLGFIDNNQCFPRYVYHKANRDETLLASASLGLLAQIEVLPYADNKAIVNGYVREDALKPDAIEHFKKAYLGYEEAIDADSVFYYIYGLLHSAEYRTNYADNI